VISRHPYEAQRGDDHLQPRVIHCGSATKCLSQCVNFDSEVVVGEDCSTVGTREILMEFFRPVPGRIVPLLRGRNLGAMRNVQETLGVCRGQYLALLEGNDYWPCDDKRQKQVYFPEPILTAPYLVLVFESCTRWAPVERAYIHRTPLGRARLRIYSRETLL
jgi:hypothetical protein